jgi:hypothetical protein
VKPAPLATLLLALATLMPTAAAHDEVRLGVYDPLDLEMHLWLSDDARLVSAAPADGARPFAARQPGGDGAPLDFETEAPVTFSATTGLAVSLLLRAAQPVLAQGPDGASLELALLADGVPLDGATKRVALQAPVLAPGATERVEVKLQPASTIEKGARLALRVTPLMPALAEGALAVATGPDASRADFAVVRVPSVAHLELNDPALPTWHLDDEAYRPADARAAVYEVRVSHTAIGLGSLTQPVGTNVTLVFGGEESAADAYAHHHFADAAARRAAAHELLVGDTLVRVHPGVGVAVAVDGSAARSVVIRCGANCPEPGFSAVLRFVEPEDVRPRAGSGNSVIPPPRNTSGVPVSQDAPDGDARVPGPGVAAAVPALAAAAAIAVAVADSRRRGGQ